jgi:outer membrane protein assembly factor BamB
VLLAACQAPRPAAPTPTPMSALEPGTRAPLWAFRTEGEVWSSPAVSGGVVYFGSDDHNLYAVDVASAQARWTFATGAIVRSRPAVVEGVVYFTNDANILYAVDAESGAELWRFDMGKPYMERKPVTEGWDYMQSSPAVADGVVYTGSANPYFYAVDAATGREIWRFKAGWMYTRSSPAVADGLVYFGDWNGRIYALEAATGEKRWHYDTHGAIVPSPTVADGVVYIGSKFPCMYAFDAQTGELKWCFSYPHSIPWVESSAAVSDDTVFVGSSDWFRLNALDRDTGELKWYFTTKGDPWSSPAVSEGVVYIGATGGYLYAVDAASGRELWKMRTGPALVTVDPVRFDGGVVSSPVVADGVVYFGSLDGNLYAVSTAP